jgi:hypothetical protein
MFHFYRFTRLFVLVVLVIAGSIGGTFAATHVVKAQDAKTSCDIDLANITKVLADAKAAYAKGDQNAGRDAVNAAQSALTAIINRCTDQTSKMAACAYTFDATVRNGPSKGANVRGLMALTEINPNEFAGFVVDKNSMKSGKPTLTAVAGKVNAKQISLTFTLSDKTQIKGVGPFGDKFSDCTAAVEGDLTGPKDGDVGDWLAAANDGGRAACIAAGVRRCIAQYGPNGSADCAVNAAAACVALYQQ